jgi:hypothetical protein
MNLGFLRSPRPAASLISSVDILERSRIAQYGPGRRLVFLCLGAKAGRKPKSKKKGKKEKQSITECYCLSKSGILPRSDSLERFSTLD